MESKVRIELETKMVCQRSNIHIHIHTYKRTRTNCINFRSFENFTEFQFKELSPLSRYENFFLNRF